MPDNIFTEIASIALRAMVAPHSNHI